jgi:hypothetical protein
MGSQGRAEAERIDLWRRTDQTFHHEGNETWSQGDLLKPLNGEVPVMAGSSGSRQARAYNKDGMNYLHGPRPWQWYTRYPKMRQIGIKIKRHVDSWRSRGFGMCGLIFAIRTDASLLIQVARTRLTNDLLRTQPLWFKLRGPTSE